MQHYTILGNHNFGISLYLENLRATYGEGLTVDIVALTNNDENKIKDALYDVPGIKTRIIHFKKWDNLKETIYLNSGMSGNSRKKIFNFFKDEFGVEKEEYGLCTHPTSAISSTAQFGFGIYLGPNISIGPHTSLGDFVFINRNSSVGHHVTLNKYVLISSGCSLTSQSIIEQGVYIGVGAVILEKINIGANTIIGAGSLVTKNIPGDVVAYGSPAVVIRKKDL